MPNKPADWLTWFASADDVCVDSIAAQLEEAEQERLTDYWIEEAEQERLTDYWIEKGARTDHDRTKRPCGSSTFPGERTEARPGLGWAGPRPA